MQITAFQGVFNILLGDDVGAAEFRKLLRVSRTIKGIKKV